MIKLYPSEVAELIKQDKHFNLSKTQRTRAHRKKYYLPNDDYEAMKVVAEMRGYELDEFYHKCVEGLNYT